MWGIHRGPVNPPPPHKWPVTQKMFPFDDVIKKETCLNVCDRHRHKCQAYVRLVIWIVFMAKISYLCHSASNHKLQAIAYSPASVFARNNKSASGNLGIKKPKAFTVCTHNARTPFAFVDLQHFVFRNRVCCFTENKQCVCASLGQGRIKQATSSMSPWASLVASDSNR